MEAHKIETEFSRYWSKLTIVQKESILNVVKHIAGPSGYAEEQVVIPDEHWALIMKERDDYINGVGKTYSWDQVKEMMHNKEKRDDLRN